ncbi:MAG TPA: peptidylprolyl isomerase [Polyangiaceae bacterium]|nr:peptidylprolyl isomerase [Polyangiaceae bacterium]
MRRPGAVVLAATLTAAGAVAADDGPRKAPERVVLETTAGDLVLALYPDVAPHTVEQIEKLVRGGVYDGTHFVRVEPGFVIQLSSAEDRATALSEDQRKLIHKLALEASPTVRHRRYSVSLAHPNEDPNAGETSFSVLTVDAPHLDGQYTVFGEVETGKDVVSLIEHAPADEGKRPLRRIEVTHARVLEPAELATFKPRPGLRPAGSATKITTDGTAPSTAAPKAGAGSSDRGLAGAVGAMTGLGLAAAVFAWRKGATVSAALSLLSALAGFLVCFALLVPETNRTASATAVVIFAAALALFRVMGRFEPGAPKS